MDKKRKIGVTLFLLLAFVTVSLASQTIMVTSEAEAQAEFARPTAMEKGRCEIITALKVVTSADEIASKEMNIRYILSFTINGEEEEMRGMFTTTATSEAEIKSQAVQECDNQFAAIQKDDEKKVIIKPRYGFFNEFFDMVARKWVNK